MHVHPISTFRLFQEGHLLRNSIAIFALTTLFYFILLVQSYGWFTNFLFSGR